VAALEVGRSCFVNAPVSEVKRKCAQYAARNGKRFVVVKEVIDAHGPALVARVTRLPVTDAELPSAA
jgi:hypothetical protein